MKKFWTYCPRCRSGFYTDFDIEKKKVDVKCPNCDLLYRDILKESQIRDVKYNWELNEKIDPGMISEEETTNHLDFASFSLIAALTLFAIGGLSLLVSDTFTAIHGSIGLAGGIFSIFVMLGTINAYKKRSFAVAFSGAFFSVLSSFIWGFLNFQGRFLLFGRGLSSLYLVLTLFLSLQSLILIVKNRSVFDIGH